MFRKLSVITILLMSLGVSSGHADTVSVDNAFVANDVYSSDFHSRLNRDINQLENAVNNIDDSQLKVDTLKERSMADEINPRIRTYETGGLGTECEFVYSGLLPLTAASLTSNITAGTGYPRGFRINKASATAKTYTASKWTWVDLDTSSNFQYTEGAINSATPSIVANSIRLALVSTDATTINTVTDLRRLNCFTTKFDQIQETTSQPSLHNLFLNGIPDEGHFRSGTTGWLQGLQLQWASHTTFKVKSGSAWVLAEYRISSSDVTLTTGADDPTNGGSGLDSGAIAASTKYCAYAVADQSSVKTLSISYSTNCTSPAGITNYRYLGSIKTDANNLFTSTDIVNAYSPGEFELVGAWVNFEGSASNIATADKYNVAAFTDNTCGNYSITYETNFNRNAYATSCTGNTLTTGEPLICSTTNKATTGVTVRHIGHGGVCSDCSDCNIISIGDRA